PATLDSLPKDRETPALKMSFGISMTPSSRPSSPGGAVVLGLEPSGSGALEQGHLGFWVIDSGAQSASARRSTAWKDSPVLSPPKFERQLQRESLPHARARGRSLWSSWLPHPASNQPLPGSQARAGMHRRP